MNFSNLKSLARAYVPGAKTDAVTAVNLALILNEGALDVAVRTQCMKHYEYINSVADQTSYRLTSLLPYYVSISSEGVWYKSGTSYIEIIPRTLRYFDNHYKNWRGVSGTPTEYALWGDLFIPKSYPDEAVTNAFLVYYAQRPMTMADDGHYPFHLPDDQITERSDLAILSDLVLMYTEWKILKILNKRQDSYEKVNEYLEEIERRKKLLDLRPDIVSHNETKFSGPRVG